MWLENAFATKKTRKLRNKFYRPLKPYRPKNLHETFPSFWPTRNRLIALSNLLIFTIFGTFVMAWKVHCNRNPLEKSNKPSETSENFRLKLSNFPSVYYDPRYDEIVVLIYLRSPHSLFCHCFDTNLRQLGGSSPGLIMDRFMLHCHCATKAAKCWKISLSTLGGPREVTHPLNVMRIPVKISENSSRTLGAVSKYYVISFGGMPEA